jgi:DNA-binding NarL/FixJ family response regulator
VARRGDLAPRREISRWKPCHDPILIADEQEVVRSGLRKILEAQPGWQVVGEAKDGKEAVLKAVELNPDIVILEYALPLMSGVEATRQIRSRLEKTEVLIFTNRDSDTLVGEVLQSGARAYVLKSESSQQLINAVKSLSDHRPYLVGEWSERLLEGFLQKQSQNASLLSPRERVIVQLIAEGHSNKEMASILNISVKTVETHRATAMHKLHITTTAGLVRYAIKNNLIEA